VAAAAVKSGVTGGPPEAVLDALPAFQFLPERTRLLVTGSFAKVDYTFGNVIVREGERADAFFVVASGTARVLKAGEAGGEVSLNVLKRGDSFGEIGLLDAGALRSATVRASSDVTVFRLDKSVFDELLATAPELRTTFELHVKQRSLNTFFRLYTPFAKLPVAALAKVLAAFEPVELAKGEVVVKQGAPAGPLYVVQEGRLRVYAEEGNRRRPLAFLRRGDLFGELSAFLGQPRAATVEAVTPCKLLALHPQTFKKVAAENPGFMAEIEERIEQYDFKRTARVPLDFAEELLPAEAQVEEVGEDQVDQIAADAGEADEEAPDDPSRFASEEGYFVRKGKRIRRFPFVKQLDEMDCGAACMAMICRYYGRAVSVTRIRQLLFTSVDGTSLRALCRGAEELGLAARSVKTSALHLRNLPLPAVIHWGGNHWVVLYDVQGDQVRIADPGTGLRKLPLSELKEEWTGYAALFDYTDAFEEAPVGKRSVAWLAPFFRPFAGMFAQAAGLALLVSALQMTMPVFLQVIVDRAVVEADLGLVNLVLISMLAVLVFSTVAMVLQRYLLAFAAVRMDAGTLDFMTRKLLSLPMSYFHTRRTGDIQRRLAGLRAVRELVVQNGVSALTAVVQLAAALTLMFVYSPKLAGVFLLVAPLYALLMRYSASVLRPIFQMLEEAYGKYASNQIDAIKGIETVKTMGAEGSLRQLMLGRFQGLSRKQFRADFTMMTYDGAVQLVTFLSSALFVWAGARQVIAGSLTVGGLVAFNALSAMASGPISTLLSLWDQLQYGGVLLDRLNDVFEQEPEQGADRSRLVPVRTLEGRVRFENVGFRYGGPESPLILEGVSFEASPGKRVAIVGRSGSGKTTLVKLLCGLVEPVSGAILFDGVDSKTLNYRDLRRRIGYVLQESYLFDDSIAKNIAFGEEEPDMERVLWASRVANAHEFVERLPFGYETRVGESGLAISGGQRQRIAIARSVYAKPPILVFDEATSALDTESERAVKENLDTLLEGRTSFVIAHRLSTVHDADHILVLEKGRLVEEGTHDKLMQRQGLYYYLVSQQLSM